MNNKMKEFVTFFKDDIKEAIESKNYRCGQNIIADELLHSFGKEWLKELLEEVEDKPKNPLIKTHTFKTRRGKGYQTNVVTNYSCPNCNFPVSVSYGSLYTPNKNNYCPNCGFHIKWDDIKKEGEYNG